VGRIQNDVKHHGETARGLNSPDASFHEQATSRFTVKATTDRRTGRPEEIGAQLGHDLSVALGKVSVHHASVSGRLRRRAAACFWQVAVEVVGMEQCLVQQTLHVIVGGCDGRVACHGLRRAGWSCRERVCRAVCSAWLAGCFVNDAQ
jgi:hypothetical protein